MDFNSLKLIKAYCFSQQLAFMKDKSKRKALFVGRRAGKSTVIAVYFLLAALMNDNVKLTYFGLTAGSAEDTMHPIMLEIINKFLQPHQWKYNNTERFFQFDNNSIIKFAGCDINYKEIDKVLGSRQYMICIDECQNQNQDLEKIINIKAQQCVSDYLDKGGGQILLAGTAGDYLGRHYWYRVNHDSHLGWSIHHWEHDDNPHMKKQKEIEQANFLATLGPDYVNTNWWRQQYLCQWIEENDQRVYNYQSAKCKIIDQVLITKLNMNLAKPPYQYILATDLGYDDDCAFTLSAYHKFEPFYYIVKSEKHQHLDLDQLANIINGYRKIYPIVHFPIDTSGSGKIIVEDFRKRYQIPFSVPKSKANKLDFINQMNSDFICHKIKVIEQQNQDLITEWNELLWDKKALDQGYRKEAEKYANHLGDATLYGFSQAKHYWHTDPPPVLDTNQRAIKEIDKMLKQQNRMDKIRHADSDDFKW